MRIVKNLNGSFTLFWKMDPAASRECKHNLEASSVNEAVKEAREFTGEDTEEIEVDGEPARTTYFRSYYQANKGRIKLRNATRGY